MRRIGLAFCVLFVLIAVFSIILAGCKTGGTASVSGLSSDPVFSFSPLNLDDISSITPLGNLNPPGHVLPTDHEYFYTPDPNAQYNVYSPADGTLVRIQYKSYTGSTAFLATDKIKGAYGLFFQYSKTVFLILGHIDELAPDILQKTGPIAEDGYYNFEIPIKAGQLVGQIGNPNGCALDFWAYDTSKTASLVRPERYTDEGLQSVNGLQYYSEPLKTRLYDKIQRTIEPRAGRFDYDVDGKLVGNWFLESSDLTKWEGSDVLCFVYNNFEADKIELCLGGTLPLSPNVFFVKGNAPDPFTVDVGSGLTKYELLDASSLEKKDQFEKAIANLSESDKAMKRQFFAQESSHLSGVMLVKMVEKRKIQVQVFEGRSAAEVNDFDNGARYYVR